jgi:hypothetical protein
MVRSSHSAHKVYRACSVAWGLVGWVGATSKTGANNDPMFGLTRKRGLPVRLGMKRGCLHWCENVYCWVYTAREHMALPVDGT